MKLRWIVAAVLTAALVFLVAGWATAAEPSLKFDSPVTWTLDDGTFASVMLRKIAGETKRAEFLVAKPGNPPVLRFYILLLDDEPVPPPAELWGIVVEETSQRTPQQAVVLSSPVVRALFKEGAFRIVDPKRGDTEVDVSPDMKPYVERCKDQTGQWLPLPILFLVDKPGRVYFEGALPANVPAMVALVNKHKGGGQ
jgi:hypothetical protein